MSNSLENVDNTCVVCFKNLFYYSIGECDHPVCYECSTRMRVLCLQNECPICRQELAKVVFTDKPLPFKKFKSSVFTDTLFDRRFKIGFCNDSAKEAYLKLLEHNCNLCKGLQPFKTFAALSGHMRKNHEVHFCDLCVDNLKIFTFERKCYNRTQLAQHRRKGDTDDTSHRGHPLCEFCDTRYMDSDELFRHLRKLHLYCHLCDADGLHYYYGSHDSLRDHFRRDHFLCEDGECEGQHLTAVFRSDIDFKAHKASVHGRGLPRAAARQARTLELQFTLAPRLQPQHPHHTHHLPPREEPPREEPPSMEVVQEVSRVNTDSVEHFPTLGQTGAAPARLQPNSKNRIGGNKLARTEENFPALDGGGAAGPGGVGGGSWTGNGTGGGAGLRLNITQQTRGQSAATLRTSANPSLSIQLHRPATSASNFRLTQPSSSRMPPPGARVPLSSSRAPPPGPRPATPAARAPFPGNRVPTSGNRAPPPGVTPRRPPLRDEEDDFPEIADIPEDLHPSIGAGTVQPSKVSIISAEQMQAQGQGKSTAAQRRPPPPSSEAFPALFTAAAAAPGRAPQWCVQKPKEKPKQSKPKPPPQPAFNPAADFPQLAGKPKVKKGTTADRTCSSTANFHENGTTKPVDQKKDNKKKTENLLSENKSKKKTKEKKNTILNGLTNENDFEDSSNGQWRSAAKQSERVTSQPVETIMNGNSYEHVERDFPSLSVRGKPSDNTKKTINASGLSACDGLTFTNSAGQSFSAPVHSYIRPSNFDQRNLDLVDRFVNVLGGAEGICEFKSVSKAFREGFVSAKEFLDHCVRSLGKNFDTIFPELVALLPDIERQQELGVAAAGKEAAMKRLAACTSCGQLVMRGDTAVHEKAHWPVLGSARKA